MLIRAPNRIREIIPLPYHTHMLIRIIREILSPKKRIPLYQILAPELYINMFTLRRRRQQLPRDRNRLAIKIVSERNTRERKQRGHDIRMRRRDRLHRAFGHARPADEERNVDVFFNVAAFAGRETVLADVEAVVSCVD